MDHFSSHTQQQQTKIGGNVETQIETYFNSHTGLKGGRSEFLPLYDTEAGETQVHKPTPYLNMHEACP